MSLAFLLLSSLALLTFLHQKQVLTDNTTKVILSYFGALSILSLGYSCALIWLPGGTNGLKMLLLAYSFACIFYLCKNKKYTCQAFESWLKFSAISLGSLRTMLLRLGQKAAGKSRSCGIDCIAIYSGLFVVAACILVIASAFNYSPSNWDSNTYNVARVANMIIQSSPFLSETSVDRQAVMPISHDMIYFPDILFENTRGLGLVCSSEYLLIIGLTSQTIIVFNSRPIGQRAYLSKMQLYFALLIGLSLILSSDVQAMQSVITKNDLIITALFAAEVYLSCKFSKKEEAILSYLAYSSLLISLAIASKSYGIVVGFPVLMSLLNRFIVAFAGPLSIYASKDKPRVAAIPALVSRPSLQKLRFINCNLGMNLALILISLAQLALDHSIRTFAGINYSLEAAIIARDWTNTTGDICYRAQAWGMNIVRNLFSILIYPFTSQPYYGPPIEALLSKAKFTNFLNSGPGLASGKQFGWAVYSENTSHSSALLLCFLIIALLVWFFSIRSCSDGVGFGDIEPSVNTSLYLIVLSSAILSFATISFVILYQPWVGRFLGTAYIPLVPLIAFSIASNLSATSFYQSTSVLKPFLICTMSMLGVASFGMHVWQSTLRSDIWVNPIVQKLTLPSSLLNYAEYLIVSHNVDPSEARDAIESLRYSKYTDRILCTGNDSWTLTPILLSIANPSFNGANFKTRPSQKCIETLEEATNRDGRIGNASWKVLTVDSVNIQYIFLP